MAIRLWSRKEGIVGPPSTLLYAEPGSTSFPGTFRNRVLRWSFQLLRAFQWSTSMGEIVDDFRDTSRSLYEELCAAYGREELGALRGNGPASSRDIEADRRLERHVAHAPDIEVLDYIDAVIQFARELMGGYGDPSPGGEDYRPLDDLNEIFREEGVGYRWTEARLVRFDGEVPHTEAVVPALAALASGEFGAAKDEFDEAVAAFARGAWRDTITHGNAALESVLKVTTGKEGTAGELIRAALQQGLIPNYLGGSADAIAKIMHGVNASRSQQGSAHGLGERESEADERLARFVLTTTASLIALLAGPIHD
jgi:hypothetical protein